MPHGNTTQIEQRLRNAIGRNAGDATKHDHVHDDRQSGLYNPPQRAKDGLLVGHRNGALHKYGQKVTIVPYFFQIHLKKLVARLDDSGPIFVFG